MLSRSWYLFGTLAILYLVFITFPGYYAPIGTGLDSSWLWAVNYLPNSPHLFGRDVAFTYGPLGFLLAPQNVGNNIAVSMIFQLALQLLLAICLFNFLFRAKHKLQVILFALCYAIVFSLFFGGLLQYGLLLVPGLLLCISCDNNRILKYSSASLCGVLAGIFLLTKFSLGLAVLAMLGVYSIISIIAQRQKAWRVLAVIWGPYFATVLILAFAYMQSLANIVQWFSYSLEIAGGYGEAMSNVGFSEIVGVGLFAILLYFVIVALLWRQKANSRYIALIFLIPVLLSFKQSFCRIDIGHLPILFATVLAIICILILMSAGKKELLTCLAGFMVTLSLAAPILALPLFQDRADITRQIINNAGDYIKGEKELDTLLGQLNLANFKVAINDSIDIISGKRGWSNINAAIKYGELCESLDQQGKANLARDRLPEEMVALIKSSGGKVDVLPWEICYCPANGLDWSPKFTLQSYSTYTAGLDLRDSTHYEGSNAPDFLILEFLSIDQRNIVLDTPASWKKIMENYELIFKDAEGRLLLKKKAQQGGHNYRATGGIESGIDKWIDVPKSDNLLFADVNLRQNLTGIMARSFFRIPPLYMDLLYESGRTASYRIIPDTAKNGLLINFIPVNREELASLFDGTAPDRVAKFKISGDGSDYFEGGFSVNWQESDHPMTYIPVMPRGAQ